MRVLYFNPDGDLGGGERSLLDLMASLAAGPEPPQMTVVCAADGLFVRKAQDLGAAVTIVQMPPALIGLGDSVLGGGGNAARASLAWGALRATASLPHYLRKLGAEIRGHRPDLIHTNGNKCHLLAAMARTGDAPLVWHVRDFLGARNLIPRLLRLQQGKARMAVAISHAVGEDLKRTLPGLPVRVIHNAVDTGHFSPGEGDAAWLDEAAGLQAPRDGVLRIGLVATYGLWKGHDVFLQAARRLVDRRKKDDARFFIIGGPIYRTAGSQLSETWLRDRISELGLSGRAGLVGFQEDPLGAYRALDVVVHASTQPEPFGRTIAEAMSCGRAVIVSRAGGAAELFTPGEDALGTAPGDPDSLAKAMERLSDDRGLRARLGKRARETAKARFSRERLGAEVARLYSELLG